MSKLERDAAAKTPEEIEVRALTKVIEPMLLTAERFTISDPATFNRAANLLKEIKEKLTQTHAVRISLTRPLDESKKRIMDLFSVPEEQLRMAERTIKGAMLDYQAAERRLLVEQAAEAEAARQKEVTRLSKLAERAGDGTAKGQALQTLADSIPEVEEEAPTRVRGISSRTIWQAKVYDLRALVVAVAAGEVPVSYLEVNQVALNHAAQAAKGELTLPGVSCSSREVMAAGSGR